MSGEIGDVENEVEVRVLKREGGNIYLRDEGKEFLCEGRKIMEEVDERMGVLQNE
ncbi:hypothetical protein [Staphylococcus saprophyticus]|uniref:hypothetical protein n=1 Tax=Staphylococcus saprophyticus TaxID=29385 RepID=UPI0016429E92|nr:hypothetical protein [Staphylococcus saprophyticus]